MLQAASAAVADTLSTVTDTMAAHAVQLINQTAAPAEPVVKSMSVWDLCVQGGFIMIVLAVLALISIYIFVERCIVIRKAARE